MSYNRRDCCVGADGLSFVEFLAGPGVLHIRGVVDPAGNVWEIESGDAPGATLYRNHELAQHFAGAYGVGETLLRVDSAGNIQVYLNGDNVNDMARVDVVVAGVGPLRFYDVPYSSEGLLYVKDDGTPVPDLHPYSHRVINGVSLSHVTECKGHLVGLADGGPYPSGCVVWVPPNGAMLMHPVKHDVQLAPRIAVNDNGQARIVYSGVDSPSMDAMTFEPYRPYIAPAPVLPRIPEPPASMPALWIGVVEDKGSSPLGNCAWGSSSALSMDPRPVTEMSPWANTIYARDFLCGLWLSDNNTPAETVDAEIAFTKAKGASAVYLHCDDTAHLLTVNEAWRRVAGAGLKPIWGNNVNEGRPDVVTFITGELTGITLNIRTYGKDPQLLLDGVVWAVEQMRSGQVACCFVFGYWDCHWPELRAYVDAVMQRTPTPKLFPGQRPEPEPPPVPPTPTPEAGHVTPDRGHGGSSKPLSEGAAIGVAVAAASPWIIQMFRKLFRRKK